MDPKIEAHVDIEEADLVDVYYVDHQEGIENMVVLRKDQTGKEKP